MHIYIYIYIYILNLSLARGKEPLQLRAEDPPVAGAAYITYEYRNITHLYICIYVFVYIYIYIERERDRYVLIIMIIFDDDNNNHIRCRGGTWSAAAPPPFPAGPITASTCLYIISYRCKVCHHSLHCYIFWHIYFYRAWNKYIYIYIYIDYIHVYICTLLLFWHIFSGASPRRHPIHNICLYATTNKCLQCLIEIMYRVF